MSPFLTTALPFFLIPLVLTLFYLFLNKTKASVYSAETLNRIKAASYPDSYKYIYGLGTVLMVIVFLALFVYLALLLPFLSANFFRNLLAPSAIFFISWGVLGLVFVNLIGVALILLALGFYWPKKLATSKFRDYIIKMETQRTLPDGSKDHYNYSKLSKKLIFFALIWYLGAIPILFLAFHNYNAVFKDKVVANELFSLADKTYSFDQITRVDYGERFVTPRGSSTPNKNIDVIFVFNDGRKVNFYNSFLNRSIDQDLKPLYQLLQQKNVPTFNFPAEFK